MPGRDIMVSGPCISWDGTILAGAWCGTAFAGAGWGGTLARFLQDTPHPESPSDPPLGVMEGVPYASNPKF